MSPSTISSSIERLVNLDPAQQSFLLQLGLIAVALAALTVAVKALTKRGR
jgi:hypothetical protein